jgi:CheY-like chemotaxis protein/anti-sigma regulatory factor (Ser/Thr protein kinase)
LREGARALRARMSDLIDFAKMSAGRLEVSPRKFRIDRLIEAVIAGHEEALIRKELDVHWEPSEALRRPVVTDPRRLRQILDNLLSNAIKYTERGGVTVDATLHSGGQLLRLEVRDTGVGIATDQLEQVFDPFYRIAGSAQMAEGSGLGLAVVRSLVDLLHGHLHVDSCLGEGTRVVVELPVSAPSTVPVLPEATSLNPRPVLIVDDAHDARGALADILRRLGCQPFEAGSGREALRALEERRYTAVLLDIDLPDLSGVEVARQVRAGQGVNHDTRLVMLSAARHHEVPAGLFDLRLDKPVGLDQLRSLLHNAAARRPAGAAAG